MLTYILFIAGFAFLIKGADLLVTGSSSLAKRFGVSDLVIGLTIVSFGTSMPELIVNIFSSIQGNTDLAIGNIVGSNIANILLILGVSAVIFPLTVKSTTVWKEIPFGLLGAVVLVVLANDMLIDKLPFSAISRSDGFLLLFFFIIFLYYLVSVSRNGDGAGAEAGSVARPQPVWRSAGFIIAGLAGLVIGGKWIVDGAVSLATFFGMSERVIGLSVVAVGTSLPELATSAVAAYRRQADIAIGNIVGSNIFNIFWILSVSSIIAPLPVAMSGNIDLAVLLGATFLLFLFLFVGKKNVLERWQGAVFIVMYAAYLSGLILLA